MNSGTTKIAFPTLTSKSTDMLTRSTAVPSAALLWPFG